MWHNILILPFKKERWISFHPSPPTFNQPKFSTSPSDNKKIWLSEKNRLWMWFFLFSSKNFLLLSWQKLKHFLSSDWAKLVRGRLSSVSPFASSQNFFVSFNFCSFTNNFFRKQKSQIMGQRLSTICQLLIDALSPNIHNDSSPDNLIDPCPLRKTKQNLKYSSSRPSFYRSATKALVITAASVNKTFFHMFHSGSIN